MTYVGRVHSVEFTLNVFNHSIQNYIGPAITSRATFASFLKIARNLIHLDTKSESKTNGLSTSNW